MQPNEGKNLNIEIGGVTYQRIPVKTHVISDSDDIMDVVDKYAVELIQDGDMLFISERVVAISQGRSYDIDDIEPSWWANLLSKYVHKTPSGIGLGSPWTMELAIREAGLPRIIFAAGVAALTRPIKRGLFYKLAGNDVNAIDGPTENTMPPYNRHAKLGPKNPNRVAREIADHVGVPVVIIDANDLGVNILGRSDKSIKKQFAMELFGDNPLGQDRQMTPMAIVRKA